MYTSGQLSPRFGFRAAFPPQQQPKQPQPPGAFPAAQHQPVGHYMNGGYGAAASAMPYGGQGPQQPSADYNCEVRSAHKSSVRNCR